MAGVEELMPDQVLESAVLALDVFRGRLLLGDARRGFAGAPGAASASATKSATKARTASAGMEGSQRTTTLPVAVLSSAERIDGARAGRLAIRTASSSRPRSASAFNRTRPGASA